jgi:hypothetical protein
VAASAVSEYSLAGIAFSTSRADWMAGSGVDGAAVPNAAAAAAAAETVYEPAVEVALMPSSTWSTPSTGVGATCSFVARVAGSEVAQASGFEVAFAAVVPPDDEHALKLAIATTTVSRTAQARRDPLMRKRFVQDTRMPASSHVPDTLPDDGTPPGRRISPRL